MIGSKTFSFSRWPEAAALGRMFCVCGCFHAAGAAALFARWSENSDLVANAPVIMVDLAPVAVSPNITNEVPPGPQQPEAEPEPEPEKPIEKVELPPDPQAEPVVAIPPPKPVEQPKEKKPKQKHASLASAPSRADQQGDRPAAPMPGASSRNSDAVPNWKIQLVAKLERSKRYPSEAHGDQGTAQLAFNIDRQGGVHNARITRSSGSSVLDHEALALVQRAQPLPPPPLKFRARKFRSLSRSATTRAERSKLGTLQHCPIPKWPIVAIYWRTLAVIQWQYRAGAGMVPYGQVIRLCAPVATKSFASIPVTIRVSLCMSSDLITDFVRGLRTELRWGPNSETCPP